MARYGWIPDLPDARDHRFVVPPGSGGLPDRVDLRAACPPIYDQGDLGSATAAAIAAAVEHGHRRGGLLPSLTPSCLYIYYAARAEEGTVEADAGAMLRDGLRAVRRHGVCSETDWPYDIGCFAIRPPEVCDVAARRYPVSSYRRLARDIEQMKACLASGFPFLFGFTAYASFEGEQVAATGAVPLPTRGEDVVGCHAVVAVGYDDEQGAVLVRNSWGGRWGVQGHCTMPYGYLLDEDLADDFWTVRIGPECKNP